MFLTGDKLKKVLERAKRERFGIIASNVVFDAQVRGIVQGYAAQKADGLLQMSSGAVKYAAGLTQDIKTGAKLISSMINIIADQYPNSGVGLHIDHATPNYFDFVVWCMENHLVTSVMIDASHEGFEENIRISKAVVEVARRNNVLVEGEIGYIKGSEDELVSESELYTHPEEALEYVKRTGVDLFAASIGTNHGVTQGSKIKLNLPLIKEIDDLLISKGVETGLVLHGASGLTDEQQQTAIRNGVVKINKDTHYQEDFATAVQAYWEKEKDAIVCPAGMNDDNWLPDKKRFDPRKWISKAEDRMQKTVEGFCQVTGAAGKSIYNN